MRSVLLLLRKDGRKLARSPLLLTALVLYPLLIALLVGLLVRYAGERPRVALVDEAGLPDSILLGERRFDLRRLFEDAAEVDLVRMSQAQADRQLATGEVLASLTVPEDFTQRLRRLRESPQLVLRTTEGALGTRVVEKMRALVYAVNLELQQAFIEANLDYVDLLRRGGSGQIGDTTVSIMGLQRAREELEALARSSDPVVSARATQLAEFVADVEDAVGQVGEFLRATANPIQLVTEARGGRSWLLSAQVQSYALALALAFVAILLGAAAITGEREEHTIGRLVRGLAGLGQLVVEKVLLAACVAALLGLVLALAFGLIVELGDVTGGQPWDRLPLLAVGLVLASAAFGALGVLLGAFARDASAAMLVAFLVGLPVALVGIVPRGAIGAVDWIGALVPFGHAVRFATASLYDPDPAGAVAREAGWLAGLTLLYGSAARLLARRLLA